MKQASFTAPFWDILACPICGGEIGRHPSGLICLGCERKFPYDGEGPLDLHPHIDKIYNKNFVIKEDTMPPKGIVEEELVPNPAPQIPDWADVQIPVGLSYRNRLTPELISYLPKAGVSGQWMLDIGCGATISRPFFEKLTNLSYLGVDQAGTNADILVDAHALPLKGNSFELVAMIAALEHFAVPDIVVSEVSRVLKPGGVLIGTSAFLEPFHGNSFAHFTHLGLYRTLRDAGLDVITVAPNRRWSGIRALAEMALFPFVVVPDAYKRVPVVPLQVAHQIAWAVKRALKGPQKTCEIDRLLKTTAGFRFVARRPAEGVTRSTRAATDTESWGAL